MIRREPQATPTPEHLARPGNCYQEAFDLVLQLHRVMNATLVHGRPTLTIEPFCQYGHAWVEVGDAVIDPKAGAVPKDMFYLIGKIERVLCTRYTGQQALEMSLKHEHYGPWEGVDAPPTVEAPKKKKRRKR